VGEVVHLEPRRKSVGFRVGVGRRRFPPATTGGDVLPVDSDNYNIRIPIDEPAVAVDTKTSSSTSTDNRVAGCGVFIPLHLDASGQTTLLDRRA